MKASVRRLAIPMASLVALVMIAGNAVAQAPSAAELMTDANERYSRGEYSEAVQQYESLIGDGFRDSALYYNLGNAYFQQEDLGRAILNYLRAARLSPRDPDINANLVLVRSQTVDNLQVEGDSLVASLSRFAHRLVTPAEMGSAVLLLWTMGGLALAALFTASGSHRLAVLLRTIVACASMSALIVLPLWLSMMCADPYKDTGVVISEAVEVVSGPGSQYTTEFTLHSGAQVRLVDSREGWVMVELPGGELTGWTLSHAVGKVRLDK